MNLNHILLFLAVVSPALLIARGWRPTSPYHDWRFAALLVLVVTALAWLVWPRFSGFVGAAAWFLLLLLPGIGLRKITQLAAQGEYDWAARLGTALQILHPTAELREQIKLFRHLKSSPAHSRTFTAVRMNQGMARPAWGSQLRTAPAVFTLILINALVFLYEMHVGNWDNPMVLHRIGALEPLVVLTQHEYWRLFTALFLHGGFLHLTFNLFALYVLGPPLERSIGTVRFLGCYLGSGVVSSAGVVALTKMGLIHNAQLIGASGCIMGVVGAWAGFLLRHHRAPFAKERLGNIVFIVVIQIAFDLSTPEVSMPAHMCGLVAGFILGLVLAPKFVDRAVDAGATY